MSRSALPFPCNEATLRALAIAFVPEAIQLSESDWHDVYAIIAEALAPRPPVIKRQLAAFVRLLNLLSWLRYQRPLARLSSEQRSALLHNVERSRMTLLRKGVWGMRTLVFMGVYTRPQASAQIGYRASARGWQSRVQ